MVYLVFKLNILWYKEIEERLGVHSLMDPLNDDEIKLTNISSGSVHPPPTHIHATRPTLFEQGISWSNRSRIGSRVFLPGIVGLF